MWSSHVLCDHKLGLTRFAREEGVTEDLELSCLLFAAGAFEGVDRLSDFDVDEAAIFQHFLPGCARQTTGDSSGP
jgi:hypothetical protein